MGLFDDIQGTKKTRAAVADSGGGSIDAAGGVPVDMLPASVDDVGRLLPAWVASWSDAHAVPDMRKASPLVFRAMCQDIGKIIKESRILKDTTRTAAGACVGSTCNRYDAAAVMALYDVFTAFCGAYDKIPFQSTYAAFCGVSVAYVREYVDNLTASGFNLAKKTHDAEMDAIRQKTSVDPVGRLAILNNEYYGGGGMGGTDAGRVVESIPTAAAFGLIETAKIE